MLKNIIHVPRTNSFLIDNIVLYNINGKPYRHYDLVEIDDKPVIEGGEGFFHFGVDTPKSWLKYYQKRKKRQPSFPLLYALMEAAYDNNQIFKKEVKNYKGNKDENPANKDNSSFFFASGLKTNFEYINRFATSTRINYKKGTIEHDVGDKDSIVFGIQLPEIEEPLEELVEYKNWEIPLRAIFMTRDLKKIPKVLEFCATDKQAYLRTLNYFLTSKNSTVEKALVVGLLDGKGSYSKQGKFYIDCRTDVNGGASFSRGVDPTYRFISTMLNNLLCQSPSPQIQ